MAVITKYILIYKIDENKNILINTLTSALDIVDDKTRDKIENMQNNNYSISQDKDGILFDQLKERGYLYENKESENKILERMQYIDKEMKKKSPNIGFTICPTMGCNLRCTYCFESDDLHRDFDVMSEQQIDTICNYILIKKNEQLQNYPDMEKINPAQIKLFGGEPLLKCNKKIVEKILKFSFKNQIRVAIITNGTTIPEYLSLLDEYKDIISIQITVDGNKEIHDQRRISANGKGTFDVICKHIDLILQLGITIQFRINVDRGNIYSLKDLEKVIKEKHWSEKSNFVPYASPVLDFCGNLENALTEHELYKILVEEGYYGKENSFIKRIVSPCIGYLENFFDNKIKIKPWKTTYCEATSGGELCFSPDGLISTCLTYSGKGKYEVGRFDDKGVHLEKDKLEMWSKRSIFRIDKCKNCNYAFLCGGGCPAMALERNQNIDCCVCSDVAATVQEYVKDKFR